MSDEHKEDVLKRADAFVSAMDATGREADRMLASLVRELAVAVRDARCLVVSAINSAEDDSHWWGGGGRESFLGRDDVRACYAARDEDPDE